MNFKVSCFNDKFIILLEAPPSYKFDKCTVNKITIRQTINLYPNFIQRISNDLEELYKRYKIIAILYRVETEIMSNFPNGVKKNITYYVYYTSMDDCMIDDVFYGELLEHLTDNLKMTYYVAQVFLQSLRNGFNKPDKRIKGIIEKYKLQTQSDNLQEIRNLVLNINFKQKSEIENFVAKNSTFNSILPNMLLLNITNCVQQESLSIKQSDSSGKTDNENEFSISSSSSLNQVPASNNDNDNDDDDGDGDDENINISINNDDEDEIIFETTMAQQQQQQQQQSDEHVKFKTYTKNTIFKQHFYYCSHGSVIIVDAYMEISTFNILIMKNVIQAFLVVNKTVNQINVFLYIDEKRFEQFSNIHIRGKILQFRVCNRFVLDPDTTTIRYDIDLNVPALFSSAPLVISNIKSIKETFKPKIKIIELYLIVCMESLHKILQDWNCICKVLRIVTSPYHKNQFFHILIYINENDDNFIYKYLPNFNSTGSSSCVCSTTKITEATTTTTVLPHSQKLWETRPCVEILFHTNFDWTIMKIHNDFLRRQNAKDIFKLYDIFETGKLRIAQLLESKVFKVTIENLTTFKFFNETGLLYPFETSGHEEMYIYTLIKMTRIVYRCLVLPLIKIKKLSAKALMPSKFPLTYAFIDDPLTPTTSVRGPQSTRNIKSVEDSERMFDTNVVNVTMLMNSFNLCGSESIENKITI